MKSYERHIKTGEIIKRFKNGESLFISSPLFNTSIQMMVDGMSIEDVFEQIVIAQQRTQRAFEEYVLRDTRPTQFELGLRHVDNPITNENVEMNMPDGVWVKIKNI